MKKFDFKDYCVPCEAWCCKGENPFASKEELARLGTNKIIQKEDGTCQYLGEGNLCERYENRPFECRAFPVDAKDGNWVYWPSCEVTSMMDLAAHVDKMEADLLNCPNGYIDDYMDHHKAHEPAKYQLEKYVIIRPIKQTLRR